MVNAQEWLNENYPYEERKNIREIHIKENLVGELDLKDFTYEHRFEDWWKYWWKEGVKVYLYHQNNQLKIVNQPKMTQIINLIEAQQYFKWKLPFRRKKYCHWITYFKYFKRKTHRWIRSDYFY